VGGSTEDDIEAYIDNAYNTWTIPPTAILLLGDHGTNPTNSIVSHVMNNHPGGYNPYVSDNAYADVDEDYLPDIMLARITARNNSELEIMIRKFIDYELSPPVDADFYDHPVTALGWQTTRWFQLCSETVGGFFKNVLDKNPVRINEVYDGDPTVDPWSTASNTTTVLNYFGESGLNYIPDDPSVLGNFSGGTYTDINDAINSGAFLVQHRDHGAYWGWGEPYYHSNHVSSLNNTDLPYILSINCQTGQFDNSSECLAEKFHRYNLSGTGSGALGVLAATEISYSFANDIYAWGVYDYLWPEFMPDYEPEFSPGKLMPCFANAAGKYHLHESTWYYSTSVKRVTHYLYHHHGDAFMVLYSEIPQPLSVAHNSSITSAAADFAVTADSGAFIALTHQGEILSTATSDGNTILFPIYTSLSPGIPLLVTITKRNHLRYSQEVQVLPALGAYLELDTVIINDPDFNNNGLLDYGESGTLTLTVKNIGSEDAESVDVCLTSSNPWLTIPDDTVSFGPVPAGQTSIVYDAFSYTVSTNVADGEESLLEVECISDPDTWLSHTTLEVHAPEMVVQDLVVDDLTSGNGNGYPDPGEVSDLNISIGNLGSVASDSLDFQLTTTEPLVVVVDGNDQNGPVLPGGNCEAVFTISCDPLLNAGSAVPFDLTITDEAGYYSVVSLDVTCGKIPVLVIDLDPNHNSGPEIKSAIDTNGVYSEYVTFLPQELSAYSSVFLCLGIYSNNYVLSSADGPILEEYLNSGGNLYMEGGDTWCYDQTTTVHPMFSIDAISDGTSDLDTIVGVASTPVEDLSMRYDGENNWVDRLGASGSAQVLLNNNDPSYGTSVSYDGGSYRTIGASHEFGGLSNGDNQWIILMAEYLRFFSIPITSQWIGINTDWNDPVNWSNGVVPDGETHVIIPVNPSRGGFPIDNGAGEADCKTLTLEEGAILTVPDGTVMTIYE